jgi:hypothetical protein
MWLCHPSGFLGSVRNCDSGYWSLVFRGMQDLLLWKPTIRADSSWPLFVFEFNYWSLLLTSHLFTPSPWHTHHQQALFSISAPSLIHFGVHFGGPLFTLNSYLEPRSRGWASRLNIEPAPDLAYQSSRGRSRYSGGTITASQQQPTTSQI